MPNSIPSILRETKDALGKSQDSLDTSRVAQQDLRNTITESRVVIDESLKFLRGTDRETLPADTEQT